MLWSLTTLHKPINSLSFNSSQCYNNVCNASVERIDKFVLVAMLRASTRVSETISFGSFGPQARHRFHIWTQLANQPFPVVCAQATSCRVHIFVLAKLVSQGSFSVSKTSLVAEMLIHGSLPLFFRQAAAQLSSPAPFVVIESLHKRAGRRQTPLCATVLRLWEHELVATGSSHVSSARHHERITANSPIQ